MCFILLSDSVFDVCFSYFLFSFFFFFNDTATTEIYTLSLHDALPISTATSTRRGPRAGAATTGATVADDVTTAAGDATRAGIDRKSTRLNSSHGYISYAVFCLKKKKKKKKKKKNTKK